MKAALALALALAACARHCPPPPPDAFPDASPDADTVGSLVLLPDGGMACVPVHGGRPCTVGVP